MILYLAYSTKNESYRYLCNHRRAYKLFTDSISPKCKFTAFPCESYEKVYIYTKLIYPKNKSPSLSLKVDSVSLVARRMGSVASWVTEATCPRGEAACTC